MIAILFVVFIAILAWEVSTKSQFTEGGPTYTEIQSRILNKNKEK